MARWKLKLPSQIEHVQMPESLVCTIEVVPKQMHRRRWPCWHDDDMLRILFPPAPPCGFLGCMLASSGTAINHVRESSRIALLSHGE